MNETTLQDKSRYFRLLAEQLPSIQAYCDRELTYRYASPAMAVWFGPAGKRAAGRPVAEILGPELFARDEPSMRAALRGQSQNFEREITGPDRVKRHGLVTYMPDVVDGIVLGFMIQVTDITHLREAESALRAEAVERQRALDLLRRREAELRRAQRIGRIGSWEWEVAADLVTWSEELYRIFGRDAARMAPSFAEQALIYVPESYARLRDAVAETLRSGAPYELELEYERPDGSRRWIEARGEAFRDEEGRIVKLGGVAIDITARRRIRVSELESDVAQRANRSRTAFMVRASSELRAPLRTILDSARVLEREAAAGSALRGCGETILRSAWQIAELVDEMFDLSSSRLNRDDFKPVTCDVLEVVSDCVAQFAEHAGVEDVVVVDRIPRKASWPARIDSDRVRQVTENLLANAMKNSRGGGTIVVSVAHRGDFVELIVDDTGSGLASNQMSRLFAPLDDAATRIADGSAPGVGLALSRFLLELMGGCLQIGSRPGAGSTFSASFPAV